MDCVRQRNPIYIDGTTIRDPSLRWDREFIPKNINNNIHLFFNNLFCSEAEA